jgi:predicted RNA binding protein YcfA (HicA-like mRNA interferase family)
MSQLERIKNRTMGRLISHLGFEKIHQKGDHAFYRHKDGRATSLPLHRSTTLAPPLLKEILKEIQISVDQYNDHLSGLRSKK